MGVAAFELLARLAAPETGREKPPQSALWPFGISGDVPIAAGQLMPRADSASSFFSSSTRAERKGRR